MGLRDLMRVFWLVSPLRSCASVGPRRAHTEYAYTDGQTGEWLPRGDDHDLFTYPP